MTSVESDFAKSAFKSLSEEFMLESAVFFCASSITFDSASLDFELQAWNEKLNRNIIKKTRLFSSYKGNLILET